MYFYRQHQRKNGILKKNTVKEVKYMRLLRMRAVGDDAFYFLDEMSIHLEKSIFYALYILQK